MAFESRGTQSIRGKRQVLENKVLSSLLYSPPNPLLRSPIAYTPLEAKREVDSEYVEPGIAEQREDTFGKKGKWPAKIFCLLHYLPFVA